jgi:hypothetical protein
MASSPQHGLQRSQPLGSYPQNGSNPAQSLSPHIFEKVVPDQTTCSVSCAHHSALVPFGSFLPGTPISQITCSRLESLNLTALTIFAEGLVAKPWRPSYYDFPNVTYVSPEEYDKFSTGNGTVWVCLEFECLRERLYYRSGMHDDISRSTLSWYWEDSASSQKPSLGRKLREVKMLSLYVVELRESAFIQSLLKPDEKKTPTLENQSINYSESSPQKIKRSRSSPDLRAPMRSNGMEGNLHLILSNANNTF